MPKMMADSCSVGIQNVFLDGLLILVEHFTAVTRAERAINGDGNIFVDEPGGTVGEGEMRTANDPMSPTANAMQTATSASLFDIQRWY